MLQLGADQRGPLVRLAFAQRLPSPQYSVVDQDWRRVKGTNLLVRRVAVLRGRGVLLSAAAGILPAPALCSSAWHRLLGPQAPLEALPHGHWPTTAMPDPRSLGKEKQATRPLRALCASSCF